MKAVIVIWLVLAYLAAVGGNPNMIEYHHHSSTMGVRG